MAMPPAAIVNQAMEKDDLGILRSCARRGRPYGEREWVERIARRLWIESTLRDRGRPSKARQHEQNVSSRPFLAEFQW
jgi:putative transposase